jgi:hypothetical protein
MGMKKTSILKEDGPIKQTANSVPVPPVPSITDLRAKLNAVTPVQPIELRTNGRDDRAGDDKMLQPKPYNRDVSISVDAIHKSSLESPTLAQATVGNSFPDVLKRTEEFVRFNIELNKRIKGE